MAIQPYFPVDIRGTCPGARGSAPRKGNQLPSFPQLVGSPNRSDRVGLANLRRRKEDQVRRGALRHVHRGGADFRGAGWQGPVGSDKTGAVNI